MGLLKSSFDYARSEMGRAILEAGQFAHVPEADVWATLDGLGERCCSMVSVSFGQGSDVREKGFSALPTMDAFVVKFGALCPVCLTPVGLEPRASMLCTMDYMPTWLEYKGAYEYPPGAITEEPEWYTAAWDRKDWPGLGTRGNGHRMCKLLDKVSGALSRADDEERLGGVSCFLRGRKGGFKAYLEWLKDRYHPVLRFNPRTPRERKRFSDMRYRVDSNRDEINGTH